MKFELEPDNRDCPDETLLNDLRTVASLLGKNSLTKEEYDTHGRFCAATMQNRFGSWNTALEKSGLDVRHRMNIPKDQLIEDLKRVAGVLGTTVLTKDNYDLAGKYSAEALRRRFRSWGEALRLAGLEQTPGHARIENDDLFSNMASVWESLGRQPKQSDLRPPISRFSPKTYSNHFGSWRKALEAFVAVANDPTLDSPNPIEASASFVPPQPAPSRRTPRQPGWRLRFLVNRRDRFTCRACGRSPATNDGTQLHLDHVKPWSEGGETIFDNLQTLCQICNIGKSALAMYEDGVKIT